MLAEYLSPGLKIQVVQERQKFTDRRPGGRKKARLLGETGRFNVGS